MQQLMASHSLTLQAIHETAFTATPCHPTPQNGPTVLKLSNCDFCNQFFINLINFINLIINIIIIITLIITITIITKMLTAHSCPDLKNYVA
jgi:hypothetical protein